MLQFYIYKASTQGTSLDQTWYENYISGYDLAPLSEKKFEFTVTLGHKRLLEGSRYKLFLTPVCSRGLVLLSTPDPNISL